MKKKPTKKELQKRANEIETIYSEYLTKLNELKKKQTTIINQFMKELEQKKMEEIRKTLND